MQASKPRSPLAKDWRKPRFVADIAMTVLSGVCLAIALVPLLSLLVFVTVRGLARFDLALLTQLPPAPGTDGGGLANALVGTLMVLLIAVAIAVPLGILGAIYLSEYGKESFWARRVRFATNILNGVPSIISGLFVFGLLVRTGLTGYSAIAGGCALAVLMLPTVVRTSEDALQLVPQDLRWAALGTGASQFQTVVGVVLPAAAPTIVTGITLALARAAGETAPLIFTALFSPFWAENFLEPVATVSVLIYNFATVPFAPQQDLAWAAAMLLILLVFGTNLLATLFIRRQANRT